MITDNFLKKFFYSFFSFSIVAIIFLCSFLPAHAGVLEETSLQPYLLSYWKLDESSGNRLDSFSSNTMTDHGGINGVTGLISNAIDIANDSSKYLNTTNILGITYNQSFSVSLWFNLNSSGSSWYSDLFEIRKVSGGGFQFRCLYEPTPRIRCYRSNGTATFVDVNGSWADNNWHNLIFTYNASTSDLTVILDNSSTASGSSGSFGSFSGSNSIDIGDTQGSNYSLPANGLIDEVGIFNKVLDSTDTSLLFNSGSGLPYTSGGGGGGGSGTSTGTSTIYNITVDTTNVVFALSVIVFFLSFFFIAFIFNLFKPIR